MGVCAASNATDRTCFVLIQPFAAITAVVGCFGVAGETMLANDIVLVPVRIIHLLANHEQMDAQSVSARDERRIFHIKNTFGHG